MKSNFSIELLTNEVEVLTSQITSQSRSIAELETELITMKTRLTLVKQLLDSYKTDNDKLDTKNMVDSFKQVTKNILSIYSNINQQSHQVLSPSIGETAYSKTMNIATKVYWALSKFKSGAIVDEIVNYLLTVDNSLGDEQLVLKNVKWAVWNLGQKNAITHEKDGRKYRYFLKEYYSEYRNSKANVLGEDDWI